MELLPTPLGGEKDQGQAVVARGTWYHVTDDEFSPQEDVFLNRDSRRARNNYKSYKV